MENTGYFARRIYLVISFLILVLLSFSARGEYLTWEEAKNLSTEYPAIVVSYKIYSAHKDKVLDKKQFECTDYLTWIYVYLIDSTSDVSLESLSIISPSGKRNDFVLQEETPFYSGIKSAIR